jgi:hypothetical protein
VSSILKKGLRLSGFDELSCLYYLLGQLDWAISDPFFVQIGAMDGVLSDELHAFLMDCDWSGVLVEPLTDQFERLKENYSTKQDKFYFENIAITSEDGPVHIRRIPREFLADGTLPLGRKEYRRWQRWKQAFSMEEKRTP